MRLIFKKDGDSEVTIQMIRSTVVEEFNYVKMIKHLLKYEVEFETEFEDGITPDEQERIEVMLSKIEDAIYDEQIDEEE